MVIEGGWDYGIFCFWFYGDSLLFDGIGGFLVYVYFFGFGLGGDIYFDVDEFWIFFSIDLYGNNFFLVVVYELGYVLGLEYFSNFNVIMVLFY